MYAALKNAAHNYAVQASFLPAIEYYFKVYWPMEALSEIMLIAGLGITIGEQPTQRLHPALRYGITRRAGKQVKAQVLASDILESCYANYYLVQSPHVRVVVIHRAAARK